MNNKLNKLCSCSFFSFYTSLTNLPALKIDFHLNLNRTQFFSSSSRDESLDSGIASASEHHHQQQQHTQQQHQLYMDSMLSRRPRQRSRHFEMVPSGRHKFEIRDLNEYSDSSVVVPLSLPKLPTDRREIVTGGLIRSTNSYNTDNDTDMSMSCESNTRPASLISTSEAESYEEEKARIDNNYTEKGFKVSLILHWLPPVH